MMGTKPTFETLPDLAAWLRRAPTGTRIDAAELVQILDRVGDVDPPTAEPSVEEPAPMTWRERLWVVPAETRLGVVEVAEALGRPKSYVYDRTGANADDPLPCRKLDGILLFMAGELRAWVEEREDVVHPGPPTDRRLHAVR